MKKQPFFILLLILTALLLASCGGSATDTSTESENETEQVEEVNVSTGDPVAGEAKFNEVCVACHGAGGIGVEGLGKAFTTSEFIKSQNDQELLAFVKTGRPISDPENTTGIDMPPKGGNPALSDEQILDIIAYIRTIQE